MLKLYDKLEDVPEALREHYKLIEGKYVPELSDDHPIKVNNVKLLNEKTTAETKAAGLETANTGLKADLESAKAHSLPRGHRAVPVADVEAMEKLKEHGTATEIVAKLAEHGTLKETEAKRQRDDTNRLVAKELNYSPEAFLTLSNLPEFEIRDGQDGKKSVVAKVQDGDKVVEKSAKEFIEAGYAPLLPALQARAGVQVPANGSGVDSQPTSQFAAARDFAKNYNEQKSAANIPAADLDRRLGVIR